MLNLSSKPTARRLAIGFSLLTGLSRCLGASAESVSAEEKSEKALVIMEDTQELCRVINDGHWATLQRQGCTMRANERTDSDRSHNTRCMFVLSDAEEAYLTSQVALEAQQVRFSLQEVKTLLSGWSKDYSAKVKDAIGVLHDMRESQARFCTIAMSPVGNFLGGRIERYHRDTVEHHHSFLNKQIQVSRLLTPTLAKRQDILNAHRAKFNKDGESVKFELPEEDDISPEEFQRKKELYDRLIEEQKAAYRRKVARENELRQRAEQTQREAPKVGVDLNRVKELMGEPSELAAMDPDDLAKVQEWHRGYAHRILGLKKALRRFTQVDSRRWSPALMAVCEDIYVEVESLRKSPIPEPPLPGSSRPLSQAVVAAETLATTCLQRDFTRAKSSFDDLGKRLEELAALLQPFGLRP
jgi:DNA-binding transcriptional MerR regulator